MPPCEDLPVASHQIIEMQGGKGLPPALWQDQVYLDRPWQVFVQSVLKNLQ